MMTDRGMRILLVAYDYPPLSSPQAIRWYYLSRELVRLGVEVHVLAPDVPVPAGNGLAIPAGVVVHRCDAGGLTGWLARRQQARHQASGAAAVQPVDNGDKHVGIVGLNWKGRLHQRLQGWVSYWVYPDSRGQWLTAASSALEELVDTIHPSALVSSHEPAVTLQISLRVASRVPVWLADLGDPILSAYTPARWRRRAEALEAEVCRRASAVSVTTAGTRELLLQRHAVDASKIFVLSQGFDDATVPTTVPPVLRRTGELQLLYTGRFYPFRDPTALLEAVLALEQVRLMIAAPEVKPEYLAYAARSQGRIEFLGEQPHAKVLQLQRDCDVLVNIGNAMDAQIPGKLFEYLGSGKPILHCQNTVSDPVVALLAQWRRGWSCQHDVASLQAMLTDLLDSPQLVQDAAVGDANVIARYGWSQLAAEWLERCNDLVLDNAASARPQ